MNETQYTCKKCGGFKGALVDFPTCPNCGADVEYYWDAENKIDLDAVKKQQEDAYRKSVVAMLKMSEDDLRDRIREISPEIRHDTNVIADVLREVVKLERSKLGLDLETGEITLEKNAQRKNPNDPHVIGIGQVAGHRYKAVGWVNSGKIRIRLEPLKKEPYVRR